MTLERTLPGRRPLVAAAAIACLVTLTSIGCSTERKESVADVRAASPREKASSNWPFTPSIAARIATLYAEDAQIYPPGNAPVSGKAEIEKIWRGVLALPVKEMRLETAEVQAFGDDATEVGRYTLVANDSRELDAGKYIVLWKRGAGGWKIHRDIWNSDAPLVTAPPVAPPDSLP
jgi:uncharacterized protein (TIGR02246 family)